jgi:hypothetical protein
MALEPPSKSQKQQQFHLFWDATKMNDINVFFIFIFIQIDISHKYKLHMQLQTTLQSFVLILVFTKCNRGQLHLRL